MGFYCSNCKVHIHKDSRFCVECGTKLEYERLYVPTDLLEEEFSGKNESSDGTQIESGIIDEVVIENECEPSEEDPIENKIIDEISAESEPPDEGLVENKLSNIVLVSSVLAGLFLFWSFLWWIFTRNGNPSLVKDLNILILFCSPSLLLGIVAIILGNKDLAKVRMVGFNKKDLIIDRTGIILGSVSVGMILSLIILKLILFL